MILKASFIVVIKKNEITNILVREDKRVWLNFGSDLWIEFQDLVNQKIFTNDSAKNKRYLNWINSPKFKRDYKQTIEVINNSDWDGITKKFIADFKKDRGNRIWRQDIELDTDKSLSDLEVKNES